EDYKLHLGETAQKDLRLPDTDFDTGRPTHVGEYKLSDKTYAHLLDQLAKHNFDQITPDLRDNILGFYKDFSIPVAAKKKKKELEALQKTQEELQRLRELNVAPQEKRADI